MKKLTIVMGMILLMGILSGCAFRIFQKNPPVDPSPSIPDPGEIGGLTNFRYSYLGSIGGDSFEWTVEKTDSRIVFSVDNMLYLDYGPIETEIDETILAELEELCSRCGIAAWDGFDEVDPNVCDGDGFSLSVTFANGRTVYAHGSNAYPMGFGTFRDGMTAILKPLEKELLEQKRLQIIAEGDFGTELDSIMANFIQHGTSGHDSFQFFIISDQYREENVDMTIDRDGKKTRYYGAVPDEAIDFAAVQALIDKYHVQSWYNYEATAEDYNNAEWFQIGFEYKEGLGIRAYGTEHPENYEAFRAELLELLLGMAEQWDAEYHILYE